MKYKRARSLDAVCNLGLLDKGSSKGGRARKGVLADRQLKQIGSISKRLGRAPGISLLT